MYASLISAIKDKTVLKASLLLISFAIIFIINFLEDFYMLFYISLIFIAMGIWMILLTYFSKDNSMGMGAFLGAVIIAFGFVLLLFSDIPKFKSSSSIEDLNSVNVEAPPKINEN